MKRLVNKVFKKKDHDGTLAVNSILDDFRQKKTSLKDAIEVMNTAITKNNVEVLESLRKHEEFKQLKETHTSHVEKHIGMAHKALEQLSLFVED